jgi:restriction system protein
MARSFLHTLARLERAQMQALRAAEREAARQLREAEREERELRRHAALEEREQKRLYAESHSEEAEAMTRQLEECVADLEGILTHTLHVDDYLDLDLLKREQGFPHFEPGELAEEVAAPTEADYFPAPPSFLKRLVPGSQKRYERALLVGRERFQTDARVHEAREAERWPTSITFPHRRQLNFPIATGL